MVLIICEDCGRKVEVSRDWIKTATCKRCGGFFYEENLQKQIDALKKSENKEKEIFHKKHKIKEIPKEKIEHKSLLNSKKFD